MPPPVRVSRATGGHIMGMKLDLNIGRSCACHQRYFNDKDTGALKAKVVLFVLCCRGLSCLSNLKLFICLG